MKYPRGLISLCFIVMLFLWEIPRECSKPGYLSDVKAISAGTTHTMALKRDGTLWVWGSNEAGQLGDGTTASKERPVQIGTATNWALVSGGTLHSVALKRNGKLWIWGWNHYGQVGDGTRTDKNEPVRIKSKAK